MEYSVYRYDLIEELQKHYQWPGALSILKRLNSHGHRALLAGGCVRDILLRRSPLDLDVATTALPEEIQKYFPQTLDVGKSFGVMKVFAEGAWLDVATFRRDGEYKDGRHPEGIEYCSWEEDAQRRDFTINALFYDPMKGEILDAVGGMEDIQKRILRAVGDPKVRFSEDRLRLLRALRFQAQLGFQFEGSMERMLLESFFEISKVSKERITEEMEKFLKADYLKDSLIYWNSHQLWEILFPGLRGWAHWLPLEADEPWKRWVILWRFLGFQNPWYHYLKGLKISKNDLDKIKKSLGFVLEPEKYFERPLGQQIQEWSFEGVQWGGEILRTEGRYLQEIENLQNHWGKLGGELPEPLVRGEDLMSIYGQTPVLGNNLKIVYWKQLESREATKEDLLRWLESVDINFVR